MKPELVYLLLSGCVCSETWRMHWYSPQVCVIKVKGQKRGEAERKLLQWVFFCSFVERLVDN